MQEKEIGNFKRQNVIGVVVGLLSFVFVSTIGGLCWLSLCLLERSLHCTDMVLIPYWSERALCFRSVALLLPLVWAGLLMPPVFRNLGFVGTIVSALAALAVGTLMLTLTAFAWMVAFAPLKM